MIRQFRIAWICFAVFGIWSALLGDTHCREAQTLWEQSGMDKIPDEGFSKPPPVTEHIVVNPVPEGTRIAPAAPQKSKKKDWNGSKNKVMRYDASKPKNGSWPGSRNSGSNTRNTTAECVSDQFTEYRVRENQQVTYSAQQDEVPTQQSKAHENSRPLTGSIKSVDEDSESLTAVQDANPQDLYGNVGAEPEPVQPTIEAVDQYREKLEARLLDRYNNLPEYAGKVSRVELVMPREPRPSVDGALLQTEFDQLVYDIWGRRITQLEKEYFVVTFGSGGVAQVRSDPAVRVGLDLESGFSEHYPVIGDPMNEVKKNKAFQAAPADASPAWWKKNNAAAPGSDFRKDLGIEQEL